MEISIQSAIQEMLFDNKARGLSKNTIVFREKTLKVFSVFLYQNEILNINEIKPVHIKQYLVDRLECGYSETSVNAHLRAIRALFAYCVNEEYMRYEEASIHRVKWIKERRTVVNTFTDEEVKMMLRYTRKRTFNKIKKTGKGRTGFCTKFVNERNYLLILILTDTGLRINEALNLKLEHINDSQIIIKNGKGKKDRIVHCSPLVYKQYLKYTRAKDNYLASNGIIPIENVFVTKFGKKYDYRLAEKEIYKIGKAVNVRANIRISPHTFRHYFTQKLVRENVDIYMIQKLLGHASIKTTELYLRSLNIENEINKMIKYSPLQNLD
jgi:integrase/recombinase XerD